MSPADSTTDANLSFHGLHKQQLVISEHLKSYCIILRTRRAF